MIDVLKLTRFNSLFHFLFLLFWNVIFLRPKIVAGFVSLLFVIFGLGMIFAVLESLDQKEK